MVGTVFGIIVAASIVCATIIAIALVMIKVIEWCVDHPGTEKFFAVISVWFISLIIVLAAYVSYTNYAS